MDTPDEARQIDHETKLGLHPKPWPSSKSWEELRRINAEKDSHRDGCPMGLCGSASTLCLCANLAAAELAAKSEKFCERCHTWAPDCRCPEEKRQWI